MINNLESIMLSRRSIRRYQNRAIPREVLESVLTAATWAPSAHNRQPWRFAVVTSPDTRRNLAQAMGTRLRADLAADHVPHEVIEKDATRSFSRITGAAALILVCMTMADMDRYPDERRSSAERLMAAQSTALAAQNLLLAAHALAAAIAHRRQHGALGADGLVASVAAQRCGGVGVIGAVQRIGVGRRW